MKSLVPTTLLLIAAGCGGVSRIVARTHHHDPTVRARACERLGWTHGRSREDAVVVVEALCARLRDSDPDVRKSAATALGSACGSDYFLRRLSVKKLPWPVVSALAESLADPHVDVRRAVATTLRRMGLAAKSAAPALTRALKDDDLRVRVQAAQALAVAGADAAALLPVIANGLRGEDDHMVCNAAGAAAVLGPEARELAPLLVSALGREWDITRATAAEALGRIGGPTANVVPALAAALRDDPDDSVREVAAWALASFATGDDGAIASALRAALKDAELDVRIEAAASLCEFGPDAQDALPDIIRVLRESAGGWRARRLVVALGRMGPAAKDSVPALLHLLRRRPCIFVLFGGDEEVTLAKIAPDDPEVARTIVAMLNRASWATSADEWAPGMGGSMVPLLLAALNDPNNEISVNAATVLVASKHWEDPMIARLVGALDDRRSGVRFKAAAALGRIGPPARKAVPALVTRLQDRGPFVAPAAAVALARIGIDPDDEATKVRLRSALWLVDPEFRPVVAETLMHAGDHDVALRTLKDSLASEDSEVRLAAVYALRDVGEGAADDLRRAMGDADGCVRIAAAWSLAKADAHSDEALSTIVEGLTDWDANARAAAASTLGRLGARAKDVVPMLERMMWRDPVGYVADAAAAAIREIEPNRAFVRARRPGVPFGRF